MTNSNPYRIGDFGNDLPAGWSVREDPEAPALNMATHPLPGREDFLVLAQLEEGRPDVMVMVAVIPDSVGFIETDDTHTLHRKNLTAALQTAGFVLRGMDAGYSTRGTNR